MNMLGEPTTMIKIKIVGNKRVSSDTNTISLIL